jgi:hypothetical protein
MRALSLFDAFSWREPASTSLENAMDRYKFNASGSRRRPFTGSSLNPADQPPDAQIHLQFWPAGAVSELRIA